MIYELEKLNKYINQDLKNLLDRAATKDEVVDFEKWVKNIVNEIERIKKAFINAAFGSQNDKQIERYIEYHQVELIRLTDQLNEYNHEEEDGLNSSSKNYMGSVLIVLKELLTYVECHFSRFFNIDATIPLPYQQLAASDFKDRLIYIDKLFTRNNVDKNLSKMIMYPIRDFVRADAKGRLTFRRLMYFKKLINELEDYLQSSSDGTNHVSKLISSMIYMNFNSYKFFAHCTEQIKEQYQVKETLTEQLDTLALTSKIINQTQQKPGVAYRPQRDSLKNTLIDWIDEEVNFLMKRHQLTLNMNLTKTDMPNDFKLNTSLSVAQLACFVRVLLEEKVIINRNQREVLKFFAQFTRTKKAENVSPESLRTRYYNVDTSTKEAVKDIIINLLNNLRKKT